MSSLNKPIHVKPAFYAFVYDQLKQIARVRGYNLVLHGSMNRDLDLIAIPWFEYASFFTEENKQGMIKEMVDLIGGHVMNEDPASFDEFKKRYHGREVYIININRSIKEPEYQDPQYYIDLSILPICLQSSI